MRSRSTAPRILTRSTPSGQSEDRLLILDDEPSGGRPVGPQARTTSALLDFVQYNNISTVLGQRREAEVHGPPWDRYLVRQVSWYVPRLRSSLVANAVSRTLALLTLG